MLDAEEESLYTFQKKSFDLIFLPPLFVTHVISIVNKRNERIKQSTLRASQCIFQFNYSSVHEGKVFGLGRI